VPLCQILHCLLMLLQLVEIVLFIVDSGCSKHIMGNLKLLINFMVKFLGTVKFGNDQIAPILGYGHLFKELKSACFIRDLKGNDLLTGSRGTDLYSITLQDINSPTPICLMAKATSSQAWLWHRRLSHLNFDSINLLSKNDIVIKTVLVSHRDKTVTTLNELDFLFNPMFDELLNGPSHVVSKSSAVTTADESIQRQQQQQTTSLVNHTTPEQSCQVQSHESTVTSNENINQAETHAENDQVADDEFINIFSAPVQDQGETSSRHVDSSNMHTFYQRYPSEHRWTKDHPLEQVIGNPSQSVRTRRQLESDAEMCMFALTVSQTEPKKSRKPWQIPLGLIRCRKNSISLID
nr:hypothetical protein [Tanacetum cinerariifolium]